MGLFLLYYYFLANLKMSVNMRPCRAGLEGDGLPHWSLAEEVNWIPFPTFSHHLYPHLGPIHLCFLMNIYHFHFLIHIFTTLVFGGGSELDPISHLFHIPLISPSWTNSLFF